MQKFGGCQRKSIKQNKQPGKTCKLYRGTRSDLSVKQGPSCCEVTLLFTNPGDQPLLNINISKNSFFIHYKNLRPEYISISTCAFTPHNVKKDQDQRDVTDVILRHIFEPILQHMLHSDLASKWTFQSSARVCGKFEMSHCSQLSSSTVIITCFWQIKPGIQRSLSRHCNSRSVQTCRGEIS